MAEMDQFDRFLTCIVMDLKKYGFLETLKKNVEFIIKKGFEFIADSTINLLMDIIKSGFFPNNSLRSTTNPIFKIIYNLIINFRLKDFKTIIYYIKGAIDLLHKLMGRNMPETLFESRIKEITPKEKTPTLPVKSSTSKTRQRADKVTSVSTPVSISGTETNVRNKNKANISESSIPQNESENTNSRQKISISVSMPINISVTKTKNSINIQKANMSESSILVNKSVKTNSRQKHHAGSSCTSVIEKGNMPHNETMDHIIGIRSVNNTNFRGVERNKSFYVGNVDLQTSPQNIIDHWKNIIPDGYFECRRIKSDGKRQSFKLTTNFLSENEVMDPANWPVGVKVRHWVWINKKSSNIIQNKFAVSNAIQVSP